MTRPQTQCPAWHAVVRRVIAAGCLFLVASSCAAEKLTSTVPESPIVIDGETGDWEGIPVAYLEESVRVLAVTHDAEQLYLMWRFSDPRLAHAIRNRGLTVWLDGDAHKAKSYGVRYAGSVAVAEAIANQAPPPDREGGGDGERAGWRPPPVAARQEPGTLVVLVNDQEDSMPENNLLGPIAASAVEDDIYSFELAIPIKEIGGKAAAKGPDSIRKLSLGLEIGALSEEAREQMREPMGGERGGGMGGGMGGRMGGGVGGRMGGGMGGGGRPGRPDTLDEQIVWLKVILTPVHPSADKGDP